MKKSRMVFLPFLSFFSRGIYRDIARNGKGANFAYLFLLLAICCVPTTLHLRKQVLQSLESEQAAILNQIPDIRIRNGQASTDQRKPHYIRNSSGVPVAIIDTTGSMNYIDDPSVQLLLTETKLIVRRGRNLFNTFDLDGVADLHIDKHILNSWIQKLRTTIAPISYGIFLLLSYIFSVLALLFVAIVGLIISSLMHNTLSFGSALRIATVAATPAIIVITVTAALGYQIPGFVFLMITFFYLIIGIKACKHKKIDDSETDSHLDLKGLLDTETGGIPSIEKEAA